MKSLYMIYMFPLISHIKQAFIEPWKPRWISTFLSSYDKKRYEYTNIHYKYQLSNYLLKFTEDLNQYSLQRASIDKMYCLQFVQNNHIYLSVVKPIFFLEYISVVG